MVGSRNAVPLPNSSAPPVAPRTTPGAGAVEVCGGSSSASISDPPPRLHYLLATAVATVVVPIIANDMLEGMRHVVTKASREMDPARAQKNGNQTQQIEEYYMSNKGPLFATAVIAGTNAVKLSSTLLPLCHPVSIQKCSFTFRRRTLPQTARPSALPHRVILRKRTTPPSTIVPRRQEFSILYCFCTVATNEQKVGGVEMEALSGATAAATTMYDMLRHLPCAQEDGLMLGEAFVLAKRGGRSDFIKLLMSETELPPQTTTTTPLPARPQITPSPPPTPPPSSSSTVSDRGDTTPNSPPKPEATVTLVSSETNESSVVPKSETPLSTPEQQESIKSKEAHQEDNETEVQAVDESNSEELEHVNDEPAVAENRQSNNTLSSPRPITVASSINKRARAPAPPVDTSIPKPAPPSSRGLPPIPRSGGPSNGDVVSWWQSTPQERRLQEHNPRRRYGEGRLSPITLAEKKMRKITKDDGKASTADDHGEVEEVPINASPSSSTGKRVKRKKVVKIVRKAALRSQSPQIPDYTHDEDEVTHTNPPGSTGKTATSNAENNVIKDNKDSEKKARANAMKKEKHHPENEGGEGKKKKKKTSNGIVTPAKSEQTVKKSEKSKSSGRKREENQNSRGMEELEDGEELYTTVDHSDWDTLTTTVVEEDVEEEGHGSHTKEKRSTNLQDEEEEDFIPPPPREKPMVKKRGR